MDSGSSRNVVIYDIGNISYSHTNNWKNKFLVLGEAPIQGIDNSTGAVEKKNINFTKANISFCLNYIIMSVKATSM